MSYTQHLDPKHSGLHYFLKGWQLLSLPGIRRFVILPMLVNILLMGGAFWWLFHQLGTWIPQLMTHVPDWLQWLSYLLWPLVTLSVLLVFSYFFSTITNLIAAPFNGLLAEQLEARLTGQPLPASGILDIAKDVPTGAIIKFGENFSSPPHIHNITYRGIVIEGAVHNDDPDAANMWMGPGSFWSQPAGEPHITSAAAEGGATIFLEILEGPYLVRPTEEAFDNHELPVNLDSSNVVWLSTDDVTWIDQPAAKDNTAAPQLAYLWGETSATNATFLKIPAGTSGTLESNAGLLRAVTISGKTDLTVPEGSTESDLVPGSYFGSETGGSYDLSCQIEDDCMLYVRAEGKYTFTGK